MIARHERGVDLVSDPHRVEASWWRRMRFEADLGARERLFNHYIVLARTIAAKYWRVRPVDRGDRQDMEQLAYEGLLDALDRFDPLTGVPFGAYARPRISGNVMNGVERLTDVDAQYGARRRLLRERVRSLGADQPGDDALARLGDLALDLAIGLMLEGTGLIETESGADHRPSPYDGLAWRQAQAALARGIEALPEREAIIIRQHYQTGLTFAHIAVLLKLTRGRVSQLHHAALSRLKRRLTIFRGEARG